MVEPEGSGRFLVDLPIEPFASCFRSKQNVQRSEAKRASSSVSAGFGAGALEGVNAARETCCRRGIHHDCVSRAGRRHWRRDYWLQYR